ncbi:MAG: ASCH domain-containing protein [Alphaproteobacteria bacterium]|nr:ASCH domain-containing protein [Alphaproteobacteria bacterium]
MIDLPADVRCLSIRQPWAHLILHWGKDIENRKWLTHYRGKLLIHASKQIDCEHEEVRAENMPLGGIVGVVRVVDCVTKSDSPWFFGPYGFVLADARPLKFVQCRGLQGLFRPPIDVSTLEYA